MSFKYLIVGPDLEGRAMQTRIPVSPQPHHHKNFSPVQSVRDTWYLVLPLLLAAGFASAQEEANDREAAKQDAPLKINLTNDGDAHVRFIGLMQTWVRYARLNDGSVYREEARASLTDISVRRIVLTTVVQLSPNALILINTGGSSNSAESPWQPSLDVGILDAYGEYKINNALFIGAGLHQWTGLSRLNVDGVGSLLNLDQPSFHQVTWNRLDKLGRFMGLYAKGDLGKFNYRISVNEPFNVITNDFPPNTGRGSPNGGSTGEAAREAQVGVAYFNPAAISKLVQGRIEYAVWETERHITPYEISTYHGQKKILTLGGGFLFRRNGVLTPESISPENNSLPESATNPPIIMAARESDLSAWAIDATLLYPLSDRLNGLAMYTAYYVMNLGPNHYTVNAANNVATAGAGVSPINGAGTATPGTGTGRSWYVQAGYLLPNTFLAPYRAGVFSTYQFSDLEALQEAVEIYEAGINWFVNGNKIRFTVMYRNRPVYKGQAAHGEDAGTATVDYRRGELIGQLQFNF